MRPSFPEPHHAEREVLEHAAFVRALARALLARDSDAADDVAQEAWLRFARNPPQVASMRAWLAAVVRNVAVSFERGDARRRARELRTAERGVDASADAGAVRRETLERVVRAVGSLREPYRSVVLLRYYEDLPPREIARRIGDPVTTVKSRLRRALRELRERLDAEDREGGSRWRASLVVLTGRAALPPVPALVSIGGWIMSTNVKGIAAAALAFLLAGIWWTARSGSPTSAGGVAPSSPATVRVEGLDNAANTSVVAASAAPVREETGAVVSEVSETSAARITGRVVDEDGRGVPNAEVSLQRKRASTKYEEPRLPDDDPRASRTVTDRDGGYVFSDVERGTHRVTVRHPAFVARVRLPITLNGTGTQTIPDIALSRGVRLVGRIVDSTGRGVAGVHLLQSIACTEEMVVRTPWRLQEVARTAADGEFEVEALAPGRFAIAAVADGYAPRVFKGVTTSADATVPRVWTLERGWTLHGRLAGVPGERYEQVEITVQPAGDSSLSCTEEDRRVYELLSKRPNRDGSFWIDGLAAANPFHIGARERRDDGSTVSCAAVVRATSDVEFVELRYVAECELVLRPFDAMTQQPMRTALVDAIDSAGLRRHLESMDGATRSVREDGAVTFRGPFFQEQEAGLLRSRGELTVVVPGYQDVELGTVEWIPGGTVELPPIAMQPRPRVVLEATDARTGEPVGGARVRLVPAEERTSLQDWGLSWRPCTGETDAIGRAVVSGPHQGLVQLIVEREGFATYRAIDEFTAGGELRHRAALVPSARVTVVAVGADGTPVAGVRIEHLPSGAADDEPSDPPSRRTDIGGRAVFDSVDPGRHVFRSREKFAVVDRLGGWDLLGGYGVPGDEVALDVDSGADVELRLTAAAPIHLEGRVRDSAEPISGALVRVVPGTFDPDEFESFPLGEGQREAVTDAQGGYAVERLPQGPYTVSVSVEGRPFPIQRHVTLSEDPTRCDFELPASTLIGRVLHSDSQAIDEARVTVFIAESNPRLQRWPSWSRSISARSDAQGIFFRREPRAFSTTTGEDGCFRIDGLPTGIPLRIETTAPFGTPTATVVELAPGQTRRLEPTLGPAGRIEAELRRPSGGTALNVHVRAYRGAIDGPPHSRVATYDLLTGASDRCTLSGLEPGLWSISFMPYEPNKREYGVVREVEVRAGETHRLVIELPD